MSLLLLLSFVFTLGLITSLEINVGHTCFLGGGVGLGVGGGSLVCIIVTDFKFGMKINVSNVC